MWPKRGVRQLTSCQFAFLNLRIAKSILSETTNIYPAQGSGLRSPPVVPPPLTPSFHSSLSGSHCRLSTGNFQKLSDHHFQFHAKPQKIPRPELIFPSDTSQVGPILIFTPHTHTHVARVCVRRLERTFEMRLKTVNSCKGYYILRLRVMNAVSAQSQILESVLFD